MLCLTILTTIRKESAAVTISFSTSCPRPRLEPHRPSQRLSCGSGVCVRTPGKPGVLTRSLAGLAVCKDPGHAALNAPRGPYTQALVAAPGSLHAVWLVWLCVRTPVSPGVLTHSPLTQPPGSLRAIWLVWLCVSNFNVAHS